MSFLVLLVLPLCAIPQDPFAVNRNRDIVYRYCIQWVQTSMAAVLLLAISSTDYQFRFRSGKHRKLVRPAWRQWVDVYIFYMV